MRVADASFYLRFLSGLEVQRGRTDSALQALADGRAVRVASDDPSGARQSLGLRARLARLAGFDRSATLARTDLATVDGVLGEFLGLLTEAQTEAMAGASGPLEDANEIRAQRIDDLREGLLALANTSQGGRYLFGGTLTTAPPFAADGTYAGNADEGLAPIDSNEQVGSTLDGAAVFDGPVDVFTVMTDLADALRDNRTDDVAALVPVLDDALDHIGQVRGDVGSRMSRVDQVLGRHEDERLSLLEQIGGIESADLAEVVVDLQAADTSTTALSSAASRVLGRSLFDFLG